MREMRGRRKMRDLPGIIARNPYAEIERDENGPVTAHLLMCLRCHEAYLGGFDPDQDKCEHEFERTLVWKREPTPELLGRRFRAPSNEEGLILSQVPDPSGELAEYLVQIR